MGKPSAPTSTSKCSYFSGPGVNRRPVSDFPGSWLPLKKPRSARQRRHSPFGPTCVSGRPQIAHVPTVGSRSIPVNASALFKSEPRASLMPFSITPGPLEWFPEGACTRPFRADAIAAVPLLDFKLLRKSGSVLPRSAVHLSGKKIAGARRVELLVRRFRCGRGGEFLEARIVPERIEHRIEP